MIDIWEKTANLLTALEAALPFPVSLTPEVVEILAKRPPPLFLSSTQIVSSVTYAGDEGGIMRHFTPSGSDRAVVISIRHIRVAAQQPFAAAVRGYQKHRVKKITKQLR